MRIVWSKEADTMRFPSERMQRKSRDCHDPNKETSLPVWVPRNRIDPSVCAIAMRVPSEKMWCTWWQRGRVLCRFQPTWAREFVSGPWLCRLDPQWISTHSSRCGLVHFRPNNSRQMWRPFSMTYGSGTGIFEVPSFVPRAQKPS